MKKKGDRVYWNGEYFILQENPTLKSTKDRSILTSYFYSAIGKITGGVDDGRIMNLIWSDTDVYEKGGNPNVG